MNKTIILSASELKERMEHMKGLPEDIPSESFALDLHSIFVALQHSLNEIDIRLYQIKPSDYKKGYMILKYPDQSLTRISKNCNLKEEYIRRLEEEIMPLGYCVAYSNDVDYYYFCWGQEIKETIMKDMR